MEKYYDVTVSCECGHFNLTIPVLPAAEANKRADELILRYPNHYVTLMPRGTFDDMFIKEHGIGIH